MKHMIVYIGLILLGFIPTFVVVYNEFKLEFVSTIKNTIQTNWIVAIKNGLINNLSDVKQMELNARHNIANVVALSYHCPPLGILFIPLVLPMLGILYAGVLVFLLIAYIIDVPIQYFLIHKHGGT